MTVDPVPSVEMGQRLSNIQHYPNDPHQVTLEVLLHIHGRVPEVHRERRMIEPLHDQTKRLQTYCHDNREPEVTQMSAKVDWR